MPQLRFEDLPATCDSGEKYNVAVLLENDDGEPMSELENVKVKISVEPPHSSFADALDGFIQAKGITGVPCEIEVSCGEGLFELSVVKAAPCNSIVLVATVVSGVPGGDVEPAETEIGVPCASGAAAAAGGDADEELSDLTDMISHLRVAMEASTAENVGNKVRVSLMTLKGRAWNAAGNSVKMLEGGLMPLLLQVIETAPLAGGASVDAVLEALNVVEEMFVNPTACIIMSCSSCRALIRPDSTMELLSAGPMGTYHGPCLRCRTCNESVSTKPFVRAKDTKAPHHLDCAKTAGIETDDVVPITCTPVPARTGSAADHVAAAEFWKVGGEANFEKLAAVLKKPHGAEGGNNWLQNEYVKERAERVARHILKANPDLMQAQRLHGELS